MTFKVRHAALSLSYPSEKNTKDSHPGSSGYTQMLWRNVLRRPAAEYFVWLATLRKAIRNPDVHSYGLALVVYGRKPG